VTAGPPKVLVIDGEAPIRRLLRTGLSRQGFEVLEASDGGRALAQLFSNPDVITLDLGLPDIDGLELLRRIRERRDDLPIVVLTSHSEEAIKVQALDLGADDYITKPFGMNELIARIRAAIRHRLQVQGQRPVFRVDDLEVDLVRRKITVSGREVKLSPNEYELLRLLVHHAGKILTHEFLLAALWATPVNANYLRIYVRQLRGKIEPDPKHPRYITTRSSIGYRLRSD
jgi:two-component system KDP operon response regulator KdpE